MSNGYGFDKNERISLNYPEQDLKLKIYYFFMSAEGRLKKEDMKKFRLLCEAEGIGEKQIAEAIGYCENAIMCNSGDDLKIVIEEIKKMFEYGEKEYLFEWSITPKIKAEIIWNLTNILYSKEEISRAQNQVISFIVDYWKIDGVILEDMIDTAETMVALTKHKEWLKASSKSYDVVHKKIEDIDKDIENMFKNIGILISEIKRERIWRKR